MQPKTRPSNINKLKKKFFNLIIEFPKLLSKLLSNLLNLDYRR